MQFEAVGDHLSRYKSPGNMDEAERVESGLHKLSRFIQAANLPYAHQFLDALDLSAADSAALARAVEELYRPTSLDSERALFAFEASHPRADVQAFGDLGNRIVESHSQFLATGAWSHVLQRLHEASPTFHLKGLDEAIIDYLRFADDIGRRAIDADFLSELDPLECTHAQLAATAQWQRLRPLLRAIEVHLGERREAFLAWAGSVEPSRAEFLVPLADLEKG